MTITRRALLALALTIPVAGTIMRPALAKETEVYAPGGVALGGYDPVAYFAEGRAVKGRDQNRLMWRGVVWRFASREAMEAFEMNPSAYAPQYGGYCAYALSKGAVSASDPEVFTVHDGRLYLNYSSEIRAIWREDIDGNVALADGYWPAVLGR